jgi:protein-disulfide isomerase
VLNRHLLFGALALLAAACQPPRPSQPKAEDPKTPVAKVGAQVITAGELDEVVGANLKEMERQHQEQVYQTKRQALESLIQKKVFEAKAKQEGAASPEAYLQKLREELVAKVPEPSAEDVKRVYDQATANGQKLPPFDQVKGDIVGFLKNQKAQGEAMAYYEGLKKEMNVEVLLPPFLPPKVEVEAKGPSKGPGNAPITIVEFSDYQCPYCVKAEKTMSEVLAAYPGKIKLVYRDFPLDFHPLAPKASEASYCAEDQGKYWEMHDRLFGAEGKLAVDDLKKYAREIGLDGAKFDGCLDSNEKAKIVEEHKKAGAAAGVSGTPAFFVNGRMISGAQPIEKFKEIIDHELGPVAKK